MDFANSCNYWFNRMVRDAKIISFSTIEKAGYRNDNRLFLCFKLF